MYFIFPLYIYPHSDVTLATMDGKTTAGVVLV